MVPVLWDGAAMHVALQAYAAAAVFLAVAVSVRGIPAGVRLSVRVLGVAVTFERR